MERDLTLARTVQTDIVDGNINAIKTASYVTKAVSSAFRQKILNLLLANNEMSVGELCEKLNCEQTLMSQHLAIMRKAKLVYTTRKGKSIHYLVNEAYLQELIDSIIFLTRHFK